MLSAYRYVRSSPIFQNYKTRDNAIFPEECTYQLFRIFCMLADMVENDEGLIEVKSKEYLGCVNSQTHTAYPIPLSQRGNEVYGGLRRLISDSARLNK